MPLFLTKEEREVYNKEFLKQKRTADLNRALERDIKIKALAKERASTTKVEKVKNFVEKLKNKLQSANINAEINNRR